VLAERVMETPNREAGGALIVNADDWGRDAETTERTLDCLRRRTVSSVSAMVFMADSERAADIARAEGVDAGLHLNLSTPFSGDHRRPQLEKHHRAVAAYLQHPAARMIYNPWLARSFDYVVAAQREEFVRLYGAEPARVDGHHHMHLSANVLIRRLLPAGSLVRRHFSYEPQEKALRNRVFRQFTNAMLGRRHRLVDYFFSLPPFEPPGRLERIFELARQFVVEVETHPVNPREYRSLTGGEIVRMAGGPIARGFLAPAPGRVAG
jgi:chitin disaccharide deacetylase